MLVLVILCSVYNKIEINMKRRKKPVKYCIVVKTIYLKLSKKKNERREWKKQHKNERKKIR